MALFNTTRNIDIPCKVMLADSMLSRLIGLLGTREPFPQQVLHIVPCSAIHTFGMKYAIDVVFIDNNGTVLALYPELAPNKMSKLITSARGVLEFPPGVINKYQIQPGDTLQVSPDGLHRPPVRRLKRIFF
jgi:uncharacterized membrane protein (UPF0127 family)